MGSWRRITQRSAVDISESSAIGHRPAVADERSVTHQMPVIDAETAAAETTPAETAPAETAPVATAAAIETAADTDSDTANIEGTDTEDEAHRYMRVDKVDLPVDTDAQAQISRRSRALSRTVVLVVFTLLIAAWAVDAATHSGQVLGNVKLAGQSISGTSEEELPEVVSEVARDIAARKVTITSGDSTYDTSAGELGLSVDEKATVDGALAVGRGDSLFVRPFEWLGSLFTTRAAPIELSMSESAAAATLHRLQGANRIQPVEPQIQLTANGFVLVSGRAGVAIDVGDVTADLREAAQNEPTGTIFIKAEAEKDAPTFSDHQAQELADRANDVTANGLTLKVDTTTTTVSPQTLRGWLRQTVTDGKLDLAFNRDAAKQALPQLLSGLDAEATNATVTLQDGQPVVVDSKNGVICCDEYASDAIWQALKEKASEVILEAEVKEPEITTDNVTGWGITQPIGGNRGFQNGAEIPNGLAPGFTTYHGAAEEDRPRNNNIERIADLVRGTVIPPGGEFSINAHVGRRTYAGGFMDAGAIRDGMHVTEVGGGISQFATTAFNAAYFAGLDILESQSHSEWFTRYPPGREATMGFPHPDLKIRNNTPYGVLIWTSYTPTSLTVTMYSTPHAAAAQTAKEESRSGACRVVVTTRTRTYPDGRTEQDQFRSTYRPGDGLTC